MGGIGSRGGVFVAGGLARGLGHLEGLPREEEPHMAAAGVARLTLAKLLNHVESGITAVYDRYSYDAEKRVALDWWGTKLQAILDNNDSTVLPFTWRA